MPAIPAGSVWPLHEPPVSDETTISAWLGTVIVLPAAQHLALVAHVTVESPKIDSGVRPVFQVRPPSEVETADGVPFVAWPTPTQVADTGQEMSLRTRAAAGAGRGCHVVPALWVTRTSVLLNRLS
jgi:hypothetical protein